MMKQRFKQGLQWLLGFERYLFCFAVLQVYRIRWLGHDRAFLDFVQQLPVQGTILDVGANIGITTVVLAKARPHCNIHAFEPLPQNAAAMKRVLRFFHIVNVKIRQTAVGNENGTVEIFLPRIGGAYMQGLVHVTRTGNNHYTTGHTYKALQCKLDAIDLALQGERITGIKIDVENYEWYVLQGAAAMLQQHRPVLFCELWNDIRKQYCIDFMKSLGYRVCVRDGNGWSDYNGQDSLDYLFLPGNSPAGI